MIDIAYAVAVQNDGRIFAAGYSYNPASSANDFALVSYNSDGSLNTNCDTDGIVTTPIGPTVDMASAMAIQGDGKIVVVGQSLINIPDMGSTYDFSIVRYNSNTSGLNSVSDNNTEIHVYPNPAKTEINISSDLPLNAELIDNTGIIKEKFMIVGAYSLAIDNLSPGIYFIRTSEGQTVKLIKE